MKQPMREWIEGILTFLAVILGVPFVVFGFLRYLKFVLSFFFPEN